ncbi:uncharacterized protein [Procambarus clarkii]|uniref:uncharacterized protein n=1 Tax=Procambarus clarkii TaxID=6728 RepID=UPI0037427CEE
MAKAVGTGTSSYYGTASALEAAHCHLAHQQTGKGVKTYYYVVPRTEGQEVRGEIYNADETDLVWRGIPSETLASRLVESLPCPQKASAVTHRAICASQCESWKSYVSAITVGTHLPKIWKKLFMHQIADASKP